MSGKSGSAGADRPSDSSVNGPTANVPRGIEVLVKKASIDPAFKKRLLTDRLAAAAEIGLELAPAEEWILRAAPSEHLETIISRTSVPDEQRRVFLGHAAAAMLVTLCGTGAAYGGQKMAGAGGIRPAELGGTFGNQPDVPPPKPKLSEPISRHVVKILSKHSKAPWTRINERTHLTRDLRLNEQTGNAVRAAIFNDLGVSIPDDIAAQIFTAGQLVDYVRIKSPVGEEVIRFIAPALKMQPRTVTATTALPRRLVGALHDRQKFAEQLAAHMKIELDEMTLRPVKTVGDLIDIVAARFDASNGAGTNPKVPDTPAPVVPPEKPSFTGVRP
jgi:hypothetical protein